MQTWKEAQDWELNWHTSYPFHYYEQIKQEVYAEKMGLTIDYPDLDLKGNVILDIGGGPVSMLLKYKNKNGSVVADPLMERFPQWVRQRYDDSDILYDDSPGESSLTGSWNRDETWMYNVLQHTEDPQAVVRNAMEKGKIIRVFEWIEEPVSPGHLHTLHEKDLNEWFGGTGKTEKLNDRGCVGLAYYGIFKIK
jgi:2-polyprenyl-3-methyl-5-hydroxy-6-metoxy-1,4-benzoquinol methylase